MSKKSNLVKPKLIMLNLLILTMGIAGYFVFYNRVYDSLNMKTLKNTSIEIGTSEYDLKKFIKDCNGDIDSITKKISTSEVGKQTVNVTLKKYNISKDFSFEVDIVDTVAPAITLKEDSKSITEGDSIELLENIESVKDEVDGDLSFQASDSINEELDTNYYTVKSDFDNNTPGNYDVLIKAVDKSGNVSTASYSIEVKEKPKVVYKAPTYASPAVTYNAGANNAGGGIVGTAYSLLGRPYVSGGTTPNGFDCSGFVQYVYAQNGVYISRSTRTQIYDGVEISYSDAQPGDIILWGYSDGTVTHSSLYVGNDQMIHAANPSTGVILSSVSGWLRGSNVIILHVRRVAS